MPDQGARSRGRINKADMNNSRYLASQMGEPGAHPIRPIGAARQSGQKDCNHSSAGRPKRGGSAHMARKSLLLAQVLELADTPSASPRRQADNRPPLPSWALPRRPGLLPRATRTRREPRLANSVQARLMAEHAPALTRRHRSLAELCRSSTANDEKSCKFRARRNSENSKCTLPLLTCPPEQHFSAQHHSVSGRPTGTRRS